MSTQADELIARTQRLRRRAGLQFRVTFQKREPFDYYASTRANFDEQFAIAKGLIGKPDRLGHVVETVEVVHD